MMDKDTDFTMSEGGMECVATERRLVSFERITAEVMPLLWEYLRRAPGRTTDFSYGGVLMWVEFFDYEYAICGETLFIRGRVEDDRSKVAFSVPIGKMGLEESVALLRDYCRCEGLELEFSAVPEDLVPGLVAAGCKRVEELTDWGDYLYDAESLASLSGKKLSKKRNHVNRFEADYPDWELVELTQANIAEALEFMDRYEVEADSGFMATVERGLTRDIIRVFDGRQGAMEGCMLRVGGVCVGVTVGDVKGDTLFVHIEKCLRSYSGVYEMINREFARRMLSKYADVKYINREDDAGDEGLRLAKESYRPLEKLRKYNVVF